MIGSSFSRGWGWGWHGTDQPTGDALTEAACVQHVAAMLLQAAWTPTGPPGADLATLVRRLHHDGVVRELLSLVRDRVLAPWTGWAAPMLVPADVVPTTVGVHLEGNMASPVSLRAPSLGMVPLWMDSHAAMAAHATRWGWGWGVCVWHLLADDLYDQLCAVVAGALEQTPSETVADLGDLLLAQLEHAGHDHAVCGDRSIRARTRA
jgi:hypothetical protein